MPMYTPKIRKTERGYLSILDIHSDGGVVTEPKGPWSIMEQATQDLAQRLERGLAQTLGSSIKVGDRDFGQDVGGALRALVARTR